MCSLSQPLFSPWTKAAERSLRGQETGTLFMIGPLSFDNFNLYTLISPNIDFTFDGYFY